MAGAIVAMVEDLVDLEVVGRLARVAQAVRTDIRDLVAAAALLNAGRLTFLDEE